MSEDDERKLRLREASYLHSSSREALIEHVFVAEVLQEAWFAREQLVDVLRSEVDAAIQDTAARNEGRSAYPLRAGGLNGRARGAPLWSAATGIGDRSHFPGAAT